MSAFPYPGWVFTAWNIRGQIASSYLTTLNVDGPLTLAPIFQQGKRVQFVTSPFGLQLLIDRTPTPTSDYGLVDSGILQPGTSTLPCQTNRNLPPLGPVSVTMLCLGEFDLLPGSQHTLAAPSPQYDNTGKLWVFDSFSTGTGQNSVYTAPGTLIGPKDVVTAKFVPGVRVAFVTSPPGLKVQVDGSDRWLQYSFVWGAGTTHTFTAAPAQDSRGRRWLFQGWSNGGGASQTITADANNPNVSLVANYSIMGQARIATTPPGIKLQVDGSECVTPCVVDRQPGTQISIAAPASTRKP